MTTEIDYDASTRTAEETLTDLRRKLTHWEGNLTANLSRYQEEDSWESARVCNAQLGMVHAVFEQIGR